MKPANTAQLLYHPRWRTYVGLRSSAGYRSGVEYLDAQRLLLTAPPAQNTPQTAACIGPPWERKDIMWPGKQKGNRIFLAGSKGRIAVLDSTNKKGAPWKEAPVS